MTVIHHDYSYMMSTIIISITVLNNRISQTKFWDYYDKQQRFVKRSNRRC